MVYGKCDKEHKNMRIDPDNYRQEIRAIQDVNMPRTAAKFLSLVSYAQQLERKNEGLTKQVADLEKQILNAPALLDEKPACALPVISNLPAPPTPGKRSRGRPRKNPRPANDTISGAAQQ